MNRKCFIIYFDCAAADDVATVEADEEKEAAAAAGGASASVALPRNDRIANRFENLGETID